MSFPCHTMSFPILSYIIPILFLSSPTISYHPHATMSSNVVPMSNVMSLYVTPVIPYGIPYHSSHHHVNQCRSHVTLRYSPCHVMLFLCCSMSFIVISYFHLFIVLGLVGRHSRRRGKSRRSRTYQATPVSLKNVFVVLVVIDPHSRIFLVEF